VSVYVYIRMSEWVSMCVFMYVLMCVYIYVHPRMQGSSVAKGIGYGLAALTDEVLISFEYNCKAEYINGSLLARILVCSTFLDKSNDVDSSNSKYLKIKRNMVQKQNLFSTAHTEC